MFSLLVPDRRRISFTDILAYYGLPSSLNSSVSFKTSSTASVLLIIDAFNQVVYVNRGSYWRNIVLCINFVYEVWGLSLCSSPSATSLAIQIEPLNPVSNAIIISMSWVMRCQVVPRRRLGRRGHRIFLSKVRSASSGRLASGLRKTVPNSFAALTFKG